MTPNIEEIVAQYPDLVLATSIHEKKIIPQIEEQGLTGREKTSAVHFLRFELTSEIIAAVKEGAAISMAIDHPAYRYQTDALPEATRASLVNDLD